jgi:hypothetical protein
VYVRVSRDGFFFEAYRHLYSTVIGLGVITLEVTLPRWMLDGPVTKNTNRPQLFTHTEGV